MLMGFFPLELESLIAFFYNYDNTDSHLYNYASFDVFALADAVITNDNFGVTLVPSKHQNQPHYI